MAPRFPLASPRSPLHTLWITCTALGVAHAGLVACAAAPLREPTLAPLALEQAPVEQNYFERDKTGAVSEDGLRHLLNSPVFLAEDTRIGIVPVTVAYEADDTLPLTAVPERLSRALEGTGFFDVASELSTDWPKDMSIAGLRELAARYRTRYLLLYRHRFAASDYTNGWGWAYLTLVGIPFVPAQTYETAGVLEATLYDAQTGTVLFTVFERVQARDSFNVWHNERKLHALQRTLLDAAANKLSEQVVAKIHRLVAARPEVASARQAVDAEASRGGSALVVQGAEPAPTVVDGPR